MMAPKKSLIAISTVVVIIVVGVVLQIRLFKPAGRLVRDFELSAIPASVSIPRGSSANVTITIRSINGFDSTVSFSGFASPADPVHCIDFHLPDPVTPPPNGEVNVTRTICVSSSAPPGTYVFSLTGQSDEPSLSHTIHITVTACIHALGIESVSQWLLAAGEQNQHRIIYAANLYWIFYCDGTNMVYRTSNNLVDWNSKTTVRSAARGYYFTVEFDRTYLHYAFGTGANVAEKMHYRRGTPQSDGSITWSAAEQVAADHPGTSPCMDFDSSGHVYIVYQQGVTGLARDHKFYVTKNNNTDGTWSNVSGYPQEIGDTTVNNGRIQGSICALTGGKMYACWAWVDTNAETTSPIYGKLLSGASWGSRETVSSRKVTKLAGNSVSCDAIGDDVVYVYPAKQDLKTQIAFNYRTYGNGWRTEENVSNVLPCEWDVETEPGGPAITLDPDTKELWVFYADINADIIYVRKWTDGSWGSEEEFFHFSVDMSLFWVNAMRRHWDNNLCIIFDTQTGASNKIWFICAHT